MRLKKPCGAFQKIKHQVWMVFNCGFSKAAWEIVGTYVVKAVQDFFANDTLLKF